jgi:hypothetical protein
LGEVEEWCLVSKSILPEVVIQPTIGVE